MPKTRHLDFFRFLLLAMILILATPPLSSHAAPRMWYVKSDATGRNDGSSWANAFSDLQEALAAAQASDQIWVAKGIYKPSASLDRSSSFVLKEGVALYGGFAGYETRLSQRNWQTQLTILSGDLAGDDLTDTNGIVTDTLNIVGDNSYHVVVARQLSANTRLDGFVITGGNANASQTTAGTVGGGMLIERSNLTLSNLAFMGNAASDSGGAIYNQQSQPHMSDLLFSGNHSANYGGAIFNNASSPTITASTFLKNSAINGGAIFNAERSAPKLSELTFASNRAFNAGGAIYNFSSEPQISDARFEANSALDGAGIYNYIGSNPILTNLAFVGNSASNSGGGLFNTYRSSPILTNVLFSGNSALNRGGGMYNEDSSNPRLVNLTFSGNSALVAGGAMYNDYYSNPTIQNSLFWNNSSSLLNSSDSQPTISFSMVQGCRPNGIWEIACGSDAGNNLSDRDPLFVSPIDPKSAPSTAGDLRLQATSPVIDMGSNAANASQSALDGGTRLFGAFIDLGAYESERYRLTTHVIGNGSVSVEPSVAWYALNQTVQITATPALDWNFSSWGGSSNSISPTISLVITGTTVLTATFSKQMAVNQLTCCDEPTIQAELGQ